MKFFKEAWTSRLFILSDEDIKVENNFLDKKITRILNSIEFLFPSNFGRFKNKNSNLTKLYQCIIKLDNSNNITNLDIEKFVNYKEVPDFTGLMKGIAINLISNFLSRLGFTSYTISFGFDILTLNRRIILQSKYDLNFKYSLSTGCAFTSGNMLSERENHIKLSEHNPYEVIHIINDHNLEPVFSEYASTFIYSNISQAQRWPQLKVVGIKENKTYFLN